MGLSDSLLVMVALLVKEGDRCSVTEALKDVEGSCDPLADRYCEKDFDKVSLTEPSLLEKDSDQEFEYRLDTVCEAESVPFVVLSDSESLVLDFDFSDDWEGVRVAEGVPPVTDLDVSDEREDVRVEESVPSVTVLVISCDEDGAEEDRDIVGAEIVVETVSVLETSPVAV